MKKSEYNRLKECTFVPNTCKTYTEEERLRMYNMDLGDKVRGIEQVHRKRDQILKKKMDKEKREKEVFDFASKYDKRGKSVTKPKPFNLSKAPRKFSQRKKKRELLEKTDEKLSKRAPSTLESKKKKVIKKFLDNYS